MILSEKILMVEPKGFAFNDQTGSDNFFQSQTTVKAPAETAMREFQELKIKLMKAGLEVIAISITDSLATPDAVFPNNWFSTTPDGKLILYPMMAENRRNERRDTIIESLKKNYPELIDLTNQEHSKNYLEGTGSLVIDHEKKTAFASISQRTSLEAVKIWADKIKYEIVTFTSRDKNNETVYHTNVVLMLGDRFAIVCLEAIPDLSERENLRNKLGKDRELIEITLLQMHSFCANCIELANPQGETFIVMSAQAYQAFTEQQKSRLIKHTTIIYSPLPTIESIGGGSARCMIAELF